MTISYDDKGKIYTNVISKEAVETRIQTTTHLIEGQIHVRLDCRIKDELELDEPFLAVTNGRVYNAEHKLLFSTKFIAVRRDQIVWVVPVTDIESESQS